MNFAPSVNACGIAMLVVLAAVMAWMLRRLWRRKGFSSWSLLGGVGGAITALVGTIIVTPDGWHEHWMGTTSLLFLRQGLVGMVAGTLVGAAGVGWGRLGRVRKHPIIGWTVFGAVAGGVFAALVVPVEKVHDSWAAVVLRIQEGMIVGAILGMLVVVAGSQMSGRSAPRNEEPVPTKWQFSLRTLFVLTFLVAVVLAMLTSSHRAERARIHQAFYESVDSGDGRRIKAATAELEWFGDTEQFGKEAISNLLEREAGSEWFASPTTNVAIAAFGPKAVACLETLAKDHPEGKVRARAITYLYYDFSHSGLFSEPRRSSDAALLLGALRDDSPIVRAIAMDHLCNLAPDDVELLPLATDALRDEDLNVRSSAVLSLGQLGEEARPALPAIFPVLKQVDEVQILLIVESIASIDPSCFGDTWPYHLRVLNGSDASRRRWAVQAIGEFGPDAAEAIPLLLELMDDPDLQTRARATGALGQVGIASPVVLDALIAALETDVASRAADSLGELAPESRRAIEPLIRVLDNECEWDREAATMALGQFGPEAAAAIEPIQELLDDESEWVRWNATEALQSISGE